MIGQSRHTCGAVSIMLIFDRQCCDHKDYTTNAANAKRRKNQKHSSLGSTGLDEKFYMSQIRYKRRLGGRETLKLELSVKCALVRVLFFVLFVRFFFS